MQWTKTAKVGVGGRVEVTVPELSAGDEVQVTIECNGKDQSPTTGKRPGYGAEKGLITMSEDFDAPLEEFEEYS